MAGRADAAARTAERILDAMLQRFATIAYDRIRLEDVASDADVTVQTVLRRFGSKPALMCAVVTRELGRIVDARDAITDATPIETIDALADHYEEYGSLISKMYAEADLVDGLPEIAARGREYHVEWCRQAFASSMQPDDDGARTERRLAQVVAICDARTWHILRVDCALSADQTRTALQELLMPLLRVQAAEGAGRRARRRSPA